jgi:hypothetical protein
LADRTDVLRIARGLAGTTEAPHFDRLAFKVVRTYATLAADGQTLNLNFTLDEQEFKCLLAPEAFAAIPNGWERNGWTVAKLAALDEAELSAALTMAWEHGRAKGAPRRRRA